MKLRKSLLVRYLGVLILYMILAPLLNIILFIGYDVYTVVNDRLEGHREHRRPQYTYRSVEEAWHQAAREIADLPDEAKAARLRQMKDAYPEATLFWVDAAGDTRLTLPQDADVPDKWTAAMAVEFMKVSVNADPFTIVALLGEDGSGGFMTIQLPQSVFKSPAVTGAGSLLTSVMAFMAYVGLNIGLFVFLSWLYFARIRKRLTTLRHAMKKAEATGDFMTVPVRKDDEIADLERSYNEMARQLRESQKREQEEEQLRRELIANLSHDLRTPLTVIRGHAYTLGQEGLSRKGKRSLAVIDDKIRRLGELIDNLLSFSLLTAGKYPYTPKEMDVVRLVRVIAASWYPVLEAEGFEIHVELPERPVIWEVDEQWFHRIWDNLFQNVLRHAREGKYVAVKLETGGGRTCFVLEDRGPGMKAKSRAKGAGIGLSIVSLMAEAMDLKWHISSSGKGARATLCKGRVPEDVGGAND